MKQPIFHYSRETLGTLMQPENKFAVSGKRLKKFCEQRNRKSALLQDRQLMNRRLRHLEFDGLRFAARRLFAYPAAGIALKWIARRRVREAL